MLDTPPENARPCKMASQLYAFRMRYHPPLSQAALAKRFGFDQRWVSAREVNPGLEEVWIPSHLVVVARQLKTERCKSDVPKCPECLEPMKLAKNYLKHWYYGRLKDRAVCEGRADQSHPRILMGLLSSTGQWQRLDRVKGTKQETLLRNRKRVTQYERDYGFVWCDSTSGRDAGCGGLCTPQGMYRFHKGKEYQIFRCFNPDCEQFGGSKGGDRLYALAGKIFESGSIPSSARLSSLPQEARCFYCKGPVHSRGTGKAPRQLPNCVQLHCQDCGKISYWHQIEKVVLSGLQPGGTPVNDPHRPTCRKCAKRKKRVTRCSFTKAQFDGRPTLLPVPVRIRIQKWGWLHRLFEDANPSGIVIRLYACPHRKIYKTVDGRDVWSQKRGQRLPKKTLAYLSVHREGHPVTSTMSSPAA
jgi:hypothetical protein